MWHHQLMTSFDRSSFHDNTPCPWRSFQGLLTEATFRTLMDEFPSLEYFEHHEDMPRPHQQRPHNRYYLALGESVYGLRQAGEAGAISSDQLSPAWQAFVRALQNEPYLGFVRELLGHTGKLRMRFAWHVAGNGCDVSPHLDSERKIGTHIFYFNASENWSPNWGGGTVFLCGKRHRRLNPELADFESKHVAQMLDNRSLLFKNTDSAWHGVEPISCPPDRYRRIFNVIFEVAMPQKLSSRSKSAAAGLARKLKRIVSSSARAS